jgi:hypothetical protein
MNVLTIHCSKLRSEDYIADVYNGLDQLQLEWTGGLDESKGAPGWTGGLNESKGAPGWTGGLDSPREY